MAIENLDNRAARQIWTKNESRDVPRKHHQRAKFLLEIMNAAENIDDLGARGAPPELRPHKLQGKMQGRWAVDIDKTSGWRITFAFKDRKFIDVRIENYHK